MARDITQLHPDLQIIIKKFVDECKRQGYIVGIADCYRNEKEQNDLYAQGRTKPGKIVTNARYGDSFHNWFLAFDILRNDGKGIYDDSDGWFAKVGRIGKSFGLSWGGDWKGLVDKPHFELLKFGDINQLKKKYGRPEKFKETWKTVVVVDKEDYMEQKRSIIYNGKQKEFNAIHKDGKNYFSISDLGEFLGLTPKYNPNTKDTELVPTWNDPSYKQ